MIKPAKLFCELLKDLPEEVRTEAGMHACAAMGHYTFGHDDKNFDELEGRIVYLTGKEGLMDEFVIAGLFCHLLNYFGRLADRGTVSALSSLD